MRKTFRLAALALSIIMLAGCGAGESAPAEVKADDKGDYVLAAQMDAGTEADVKKINDAFAQALTEKSGAKIMEYLDPNFGVQEEELTAFLVEATKWENGYEILDTYYISGVEKSDVSIRVKKSSDAEDYIMVTPASEDICATMYVSENDGVSQMITLLTAKTDAGRKIVWIDTSDYAYYGKTAPEYFALAKEAKENGKEILGYVYTQMMYNICQPGNLLFYKETDAMNDYANEISTWGDGIFPIEFFDGSRKVHLIGLSLEEEGVIPMIFYQTDVDIKSAEFKEDAARIKDAVVKKYPELAEVFSRITVHGTNADPENATEQYDYESVVFDIK